jgi:mannose-1-phosphate guanylyltransferase/phosphomannomutase
MKAIVMAGGAGSRLRPLTIERPKPMVPIVNKPVMAHIFDLLKRNNITEVVVTVQYLANLIQDFFGDGSSLGMHIHYSVEESPLGTAGSVKNAQNLLDDTFLVISGDALTNLNLTELIEYHKQKNTLATLALYTLPNPVEYGVITINNDGQITEFQEKPGRGSIMSDHVNTGIYVLEPEIMDSFDFNIPFDFANDLFPMVHEKGLPLYGYITDGYWCDVGNIPEYMRATADALKGKIEGLNLGRYLGNGIWAGHDVEIAVDAHLEGPIYLGNSVQIKGKAVIRGPTVIRDYTIVDNEAQIDRSVVWRNCYIGERVQISGAVVLRQCSLKANATVFEGAVIGDGTIIGESAIIHPSVKIWPGKEVEPGATVNSSIIWGSQGRRVLFGRFGVTGVVNIDLTPEFSAKLGAAFGATLPKGSVVTINRDMHRSPRMIKRAIISGLPSAGVDVWDLGSQPIPVARYYTKICEAYGGIHVRLSPSDQRVVDIFFMESEGVNLSKNHERSVEHVFFREDFRRVYLDDIGNINFAGHAKESYIEDFLKHLNTKAIKEADFELVIDFADEPTARVLPIILDELHCNVVALNANVDKTGRGTKQPQFQTALKQLQIVASALGAQLGVRLDPGGEKIYLVDDRGYLLQDITACAALVDMAFRDAPGGTVAIPINLPNLFEKIAQRHNGKIIRTGIHPNALIKAAQTENVLMAGDGEGNFIFPDFHCAVDGLMALAKTLEFMATQKVSLGEVVAKLDPYFIAERKVSCVWEAKARTMRLINEKFENYKHQAINGVKIDLDANKWVLIVPDPDQPYFRVISEAESQSEAEALVDEYAHTVEKISPLE